MPFFCRFFIVFLLPRAVIVNTYFQTYFSRGWIKTPVCLWTSSYLGCWGPVLVYRFLLVAITSAAKQPPPPKRFVDFSLPLPLLVISYFLGAGQGAPSEASGDCARFLCCGAKEDGMIKTMRSSWRVEGAVGRTTTSTTTTILQV